jgi:hypothetical protein
MSILAGPKTSAWVVAGFVIGALAACENTSSIYRTVSLDQGTSVVTDAKQRVVTNTKAGENEIFYGRNKPDRIVCAEPSPDVTQALSTALSIAVETAKAGSGSLGVSTSASVAQLGERLATIQLLRDELADLCRSYANGAVSTTTYTLRLSRLDQKMVTLLMGEMAAGAFGRELAGLGGTSQAATDRVGSPAEIEKARLDVEEQIQKIATLKDEIAAAKAAEEDVGAKETQLVTEEKELERRNRLLLALLRQSASAFAQSTAAGGIGVVAAHGQAANSATLISLQQNFLDQDDLGTLLAACISSLDARVNLNQEENARLASISAELESLTRARTDALRKYTQTQALIPAREASLGDAKDGLARLSPDARAEDRKAASDEIRKLENELAALRAAAQQAQVEMSEGDTRIAQALEQRAGIIGGEGLSKLGVWCSGAMPALRQAIDHRFDAVAALREKQALQHAETLRARLQVCGQLLIGQDPAKLPEEVKTACTRLLADAPATTPPSAPVTPVTVTPAPGT